MASGRFVAYYTQQGSSSLEEQMESVTAYLGTGNWRLCRQYVEVDSRPRHYPELTKALDACRSYNAVLVIAKLARLTNRNWERVCLGASPICILLRDAGVRFVAIDSPEVNQGTIHVLAEQAEQHAKYLSERQKDAAANAMEYGRKYGGLRVPMERWLEINRLGRVVQARKRQQWERRYRPLIDQIRALGIKTLPAIAAELNNRGEQTAWGCQWTKTQVHRVLKRTPAT